MISSDIFSGARELEEAKQENNPMPDMLARNEVTNQDILEILELNVSKLILTNCRAEATSVRSKFDKNLQLLKNTKFFQQKEWPLSNDTSNKSRISPLFDKHVYETYLYNNPLANKLGCVLPEPQSTNTALHLYYTMTTDSLKKVGKIFDSQQIELII